MTEEERSFKIRVFLDILRITDVIGQVDVRIFDTIDICYLKPIDVIINSFDITHGKLYVITKERTYFAIEDIEYDIEDFRPYFRPLSDITQEEQAELDKLDNSGYDWQFLQALKKKWYIKHNFDFYKLIEKGMAIVASKNTFNIF